MTAQLDELERRLAEAAKAGVTGWPYYEIARDALRWARSMEADARRYRYLVHETGVHESIVARERIIEYWWSMTEQETHDAIDSALAAEGGRQ